MMSDPRSRQSPSFLRQIFIILTTATLAATSISALTILRAPRIEVHPKDAAAPAGSTLRLICSASSGGASSQPLVIVWHNASSGQPVPGGRGPTLVFSSFDASQSGRYYCNASAADAGWAISRPAWARLASLGPKFASDPVSQTVIVGQVTELSCRPPIVAAPPASISWRRNGQLLRAANNGLVLAHPDGQQFNRFRVLPHVDGGVKLRIVDARPADSGEYACVASNEAGELHSASAVLTVVGNRGGGDGGGGGGGGVRSGDQQVVIRSAPVDTEAAIGDSAIFECRADGSPTPRVAWRHDSGVSMDARRIIDHGNGTLSLFNVTLEDAGTYVCEATTPSGRASASATLSVLTRPVIVAGPTDQVVHLGGRAVFTCRVAGSPQPTIYWSKDFGPYLFHGVASSGTGGSGEDSSNENGAKSSAVMVVEPDGSLTVSPVRPRHQGRYQCHATSHLGTAVASARLSVLSEPPRTPASPVLTVGPQSQTLLRGRTLLLPCRLDGVDLAAHRLRIVWLKDGQRLSLNGADGSGRQHVSLDGSLRVFELRPSDSGNYTCRAELDDRPAARWPLPARIRVVNIPQQTSGSRRPQPSPPVSLSVVDRGPGWALLKIIGGGDGEVGCRQLVEWDCGSGWTTAFSWSRLAESSLVRVDTGAGGIGLTTAPADCRFLARSVCPLTVDAGGEDGGSVSRPSPVSPSVRLEPPEVSMPPTLPETGRQTSLMIADWQVETVDPTNIRVRWRLLRSPASRVRVRAAGRRVRLADCLTKSSTSVLPAGEHCSLSETEALTELLLDEGESKIPQDVEGNERVAFADVSEESLLLDGLAAFACYRIVLTSAFGQDVIFEKKSRLAITGDAAPSLAPVAVFARRLGNGTLEVSWLPPPLTGRRGAITGYELRLLDLRRQPSDFVRSVSIDGARTRSILISNPSSTASSAESLGVRLAARNCRGVGPESPELPVPRIDVGNESSTFTLLPRASVLVIAVTVGGAVWLSLAAVIACALRRVWQVRKRRQLRNRQARQAPPLLPPPGTDFKRPSAAAPPETPQPAPLVPPPRLTTGLASRPPPSAAVKAATSASSSASPYASASVVHSFTRDSGHEDDSGLSAKQQQQQQQQAYRQQTATLHFAEGCRLNCQLQHPPREHHMPQANCHSVRVDAGTSDDSNDVDEVEDSNDDAAVDADVDDVASVVADDVAKHRRHHQLVQLRQKQQRWAAPDSSIDGQSCSTADGCRCCLLDSKSFAEARRNERRRRRNARRLQADRPLPPPPLSVPVTLIASFPPR